MKEKEIFSISIELVGINIDTVLFGNTEICLDVEDIMPTAAKMHNGLSEVVFKKLLGGKGLKEEPKSDGIIIWFRIEK